MQSKGFTNREINLLKDNLKSAFDIKFVFNRWTLGDDFCKKVLKLTEAQLNNVRFDLLTHLGFKQDEIEKANAYCCGTMTVEGAPHLKKSTYRFLIVQIRVVERENVTFPSKVIFG